MAKPINGTVYKIYKCPNCGNDKLIVLFHKNYVLYRCKKCDSKYTREELKNG